MKLPLRFGKPKDNPEARMSLMGHLEEFRSRILRIAVYVFVAFVVALFLYDHLIEFMLHPWCDSIREAFARGESMFTAEQVEHCSLRLDNPTEGLSVKLKVSAYAGFGIAMPFILREIWGFISPGLTKREKRWAAPVVPVAFFFFCVGIALGYYTMPRALDFLISVAGEDFNFQLRANEYFSFFSFLMLAFGVTFQFPMLLVLLMATRLITWRQLFGTWRYALVGTTAFAAVVTPSQDPITLLFMVVPMTIFYFGAVLVGYFIFNEERGRKSAKGSEEQ